MQEVLFFIFTVSRRKLLWEAFPSCVLRENMRKYLCGIFHSGILQTAHFI